MSSGRFFASMTDVEIAYEQGEVSLHTLVWVRVEPDAEVETDTPELPPEVTKNSDSSESWLYWMPIEENLLPKVEKVAERVERIDGTVEELTSLTKVVFDAPPPTNGST